MPSDTVLSEEEQWRICMSNFYTVAIIQGRLAYFLMSIHAVNPYFLNSLFPLDLYPYIWANMVYGMAILIFTRPSLSSIAPLNRISFGILGSLMFNHSSLICFRWVSTIFADRPYVLTFMSFMSGRIMIIHLLAFLYHIDTRTNIPGAAVPRDAAFEGMYAI